MASGQVLAKLRTIYAKAESEVNAWNNSQTRLVSLLGTAANILGRLPVLADPAHYSGPLADLDPGYPQALYQKQIEGLEYILKSMQNQLEGMAVATAAMEKLCKDANSFIQQDKRLTPSVRSAASGPVPSINQCLQGLQEIRNMYAAELKLQRALVSEVRYDRSESDVAQIKAAAAARTNVNERKVKELLYTVAATAEVNR